MRKKIATIAVAGGLGLTGTALLVPGLAPAALAQTASPSPSTGTGTGTGVTDRVSALREALAGLVSDRTLTQAQADRVATTLADRFPGRGGHGGRHGVRLPSETVAGVLGVTVEELRTQREAGRTLAQIAEAEGVSRADLISKLVAAARTQLAAEVTAGRLSQAQADQLSADLTERVTAKVDKAGGGRGHGPRDGADDRTPSATPTASASPTA